MSRAFGLPAGALLVKKMPSAVYAADGIFLCGFCVWGQQLQGCMEMVYGAGAGMIVTSLRRIPPDLTLPSMSDGLLMRRWQSG
jgi:hypothetical protein